MNARARCLHATGLSARATLGRWVRRGNRTVLLTPDPGPRLGNFLYFWLHAFIEQQRSHDYRVQTPAYMSEWLDVLPYVRQHLAVTKPEVRPWDRREWPNPRLFQTFGVDYGREDVAAFVRTALLPSPLLTPMVVVDRGTVAINVRRGDYYTEPHFRREFGFDIVAYLDEAVARALAHAPIDRFTVVSDDPDWCRDNVQAMLSQSGAQVSYSDPADTPADNFRAIAGAARLIGTNSTFSYWGGYVGQTVFGAASHVIMPGLHARSVNAGVAYQLDDRWDVVAEPPGGWLVP